MAWRLSTGLRNALLEYAANATNGITGTTISFGDGNGSGGNDTINDSGNGLGSVVAGDMLTIIGSTSNDKTVRALNVSAGTIEVAAGSFTAEGAGAQVIIVTCVGGSYAGIFRNGVMEIRTGPQPADPDAAETGSLLLTITLNGGAFVAGAPANGINFGQVSDGEMKKAIDPATGVAEIWSGIAVADGTAGWFRIYTNDYDDGADSTAVRLDGSVATSGSQLNMTSTSIITGVATTIDSVSLNMPAVV